MKVSFMKQAKKEEGSISSFLSSARLTVGLIACLVALSIAGACLPQIGQTDRALVSSRGFATTAPIVAFFGLHDVFNSWTFIAFVTALFVNLFACTVLRMPARIRTRLNNDDFLNSSAVASLRESVTIHSPCSAQSMLEYLSGYMKTLGYRAIVRGNSAIFLKGSAGWVAAPLTHLGLFVLLIGILISTLFSYSGMLYLTEGDKILLCDWARQVGPLASVRAMPVMLLSTRKEVHAGGEPKQWFSQISVVDKKMQTRIGTFSVNHPLSVEGIDFYQTDWKVVAVTLSINDRKVKVPIEDATHDKMGTLKMASDLVLILRLDENAKIKAYLKAEGFDRPRFLATLSEGQSVPNFPLRICYERKHPQSGIKFKCDPGLGVTYTSFFLFLLGSFFVALPNLRVWAAVEPTEEGLVKCVIGFKGIKSAHLMRADLQQVKHVMRQQVFMGCLTDREVVRVEH